MDGNLTEFEESVSFDLDDPDFAPPVPRTAAHEVFRGMKFAAEIALNVNKFSKMYALVFWLASKTTSVVAEDDLCPIKDEGDITAVKYGQNKRLYKAKIVKKSDDKGYLQYLRVSTEGEILKKDQHVSNKFVAAQKSKLSQKVKDTEQRKRANVNFEYENLLQSKAVFEDSSSEEPEEEEDQMVNKESSKMLVPQRSDSPTNQIAELEKKLVEMKKAAAAHANKASSCKKNSNSPVIPVKKTFNEQAGTSSSTMPVEIADDVDDFAENPLQICRKPGSGRVLLCNSYNVWIDKGELTYMQRWLRDPKELTRQLLKQLIGRDNLKNMCARGRSRTRSAIPKDILSCVEYYVNKKTTGEKLKPADFTSVVNYMCGTMRHPKI